MMLVNYRFTCLCEGGKSFRTARDMNETLVAHPIFWIPDSSTSDTRNAVLGGYLESLY
jgi:hypothetical protein